MLLACFDIGSNALRYLIAEWREGKLVERYIGGEITAASDAINEMGEIEVGSLTQTVMALKRFVSLAKAAGAVPICALATAVFREARNASYVIEKLESDIGVPIICLSQVAEARLGFISAISAMTGIGETSMDSIAFADVGGRSTELVIGDAFGNVHSVYGLSIGSRKLTRDFITAYPIPYDERLRLHSFIQRELSPYMDIMRAAGHLIVSGGTAVALAMLANNTVSFSTDVLHGTALRRSYLTSVLEMLGTMSLKDCEALLNFEPKRAPVFYAGVAIIDSLVRIGGFNSALVSAKCLMHGALEKLLKLQVDLTSRDEIAKALNEV
ncbi:MAG: hypothetical protein RMK18_03680 [Armatimonadota bacterium]|nr:hypothetical protein [Armatimonadota bacterium]MCX7778240.1 hypothetical protein [Armatimonadota bacterium]MDW8024949.1 hypothetical protein [Armatimonadota bacterium]